MLLLLLVLPLLSQFVYCCWWCFYPYLCFFCSSFNSSCSSILLQLLQPPSPTPSPLLYPFLQLLVRVLFLVVAYWSLETRASNVLFYNLSVNVYLSGMIKRCQSFSKARKKKLSWPNNYLVIFSRYFYYPWLLYMLSLIFASCGWRPLNKALCPLPTFGLDPRPLLKVRYVL